MITKINWKPTKKDLFNFGLVLIIGFGLISAALWKTGRPHAAFLTVSIASAVGVLAMVVPVAAKPFYWVWMSVGFAVGSVVSRFVLIVIFILVITPAGLISRWCGRDVLRRRKPGNETYWDDHPATGDKASFKHLF